MNKICYSRAKGAFCDLPRSYSYFLQISYLVNLSFFFHLKRISNTWFAFLLSRHVRLLVAFQVSYSNREDFFPLSEVGKANDGIRSRKKNAR